MADTSTNKIVLDYTARDFDSVRQMLVGIGQGKFPDWVTAGEAGDFGTLLLELYAYAADVMNYYIDRVGSEAFLGTAQRRQSVLYIADMLGYTAIGQQSASTILTLSMANTADVDSFTLPAGTEIRTTGANILDLPYETDYEVAITRPTTTGTTNTVTVTASEGLTVVETVGVSKGIANAEYELAETGVIYNSVSIITHEGNHTTQWYQVDQTLSAAPHQPVFSTYVDDNGKTHIVFGDNAAGRIPVTGAEIIATYRWGHGEAGNTPPRGSINEIVGLDVPNGVTITNQTVPSGGADIETTDSMKFSVPRSTQVQHRAVTLDDYTALALQVPGVGKAVAHGQVYSNVTVRFAPVGGTTTPAPGQMLLLRSSIESWLSPRVMLGSKVFVEDVYWPGQDVGSDGTNTDAGWEDITVKLDLVVADGYSRLTTANNVVSAIENVVAFDNVDFGTKVTIGEIYRAAINVSGVDYIDLTSMYSTSYGSEGTVNNIPTIADRIPRIKPVQTDSNGNTISSSAGVIVTATGGLVS